MRHFIHIFVLIAFVLAGVSPACKFVSGTKAGNLIEICTLEGIKLLPQTGDSAPVNEHQKSKAFSDCVFCFARDHSKATGAGSFTLPKPFLIALREAAPVDPQALDTFKQPSFQARAPPV